MTRFRGRRLATTVAAAAALLLAACSTTSGGGDDEPQAGSGETAAGGDVVAAGTYPIESLDPHGAQGAASGTVFASQAIYSRLVRPAPDGSLVGDLADSWEANADVTQWTFTLRDDATFSDGEPVTAEDVVASFDRMIALDGPNAGNFPEYTMTAASDTEVTITSPAPDAAVPGKLLIFFVIPAGVAPEDTAFFAEPVGSGPFTVGSFTPGDSLELVPNEDYWRDVPQLDSVTVRNIPELSARLTALRTGEVDVVWGIPDDQLGALQGDDALTVEAVPSTAVYTMWFNSSIPALSTPEVRRALWQAVDFETIISTLYPETGTLSEAPVSPLVLGYSPQEPVGYDPEAAQAALTAAGFDFSQTLRLQFANAEFRPFVQAVVSDLAEIGVTVEPLEKEQAVFTEDLLALNWDINFQQLATPTYDAASNLGRLYTCAAGRNGYCNPELDALLAAASATSDEAERTDLYGQASEIIWRDAVGMYPMAVSLAYAWNSDLEGFTPDPSGLPDFSTVTVSGS
ncbi:ABC transporter substrate-binding protein [Jiangella rhizosphaerae]|uniref:ABC transporter substrate-binding protein n=1 Tax=Jiangella rhizosphaerae TaxID=2293569 RepID=A0A418KPC9_9ACTN|nr:ABC transporter substrate-binding protein [Jiangella rhizosphaerae]RIQ21240.1 ABC transporter substrate-binding protein [Jiangella rhizosphaerae]